MRISRWRKEKEEERKGAGETGREEQEEKGKTSHGTPGALKAEEEQKEERKEEEKECTGSTAMEDLKTGQEQGGSQNSSSWQQT